MRILDLDWENAVAVYVGYAGGFLSFLISYLGTSLVTSHFLGEKSYLKQAVLAILFSVIIWLTTKVTVSFWTPPNIFPGRILAFEYLLICVFILVFFHLRSEGRLSGFSWEIFGQLFKGTFFSPRKIFELITVKRSIAYSFVSVSLVSLAWVVRDLVYNCWQGVEPYFRSISPYLGGWTEVTALIIPVGLLLWLTITGLLHKIACRFNGYGSYSQLASMLGFVFMPSIIKVVFDVTILLALNAHIEYSTFLLGPLTVRYLTMGNMVTDVAFWLIFFCIPLLIWPLLLGIFAVQMSEKLTFLEATITIIIVLLPLFLLLTQLL